MKDNSHVFMIQNSFSKIVFLYNVTCSNSLKIIEKQILKDIFITHKIVKDLNKMSIVSIKKQYIKQKIINDGGNWP